MKQTAVEWLVNQYIEKLTITPAMVEQAKAMEEKQSINLIFKYIEDNLDPSTHGNIENVKEWFELNKSE